MTVVYCFTRDFPNLEDQVPVFMLPQGGTVTPPGAGFPLRRLLQLARLRWGHSNPPPRLFDKLWRYRCSVFF
jgi:hypothetical protein